MKIVQSVSSTNSKATCTDLSSREHKNRGTHCALEDWMIRMIVSVVEVGLQNGDPVESIKRHQIQRSKMYAEERSRLGSRRRLNKKKLAANGSRRRVGTSFRRLSMLRSWIPPEKHSRSTDRNAWKPIKRTKVTTKN